MSDCGTGTRTRLSPRAQALLATEAAGALAGHDARLDVGPRQRELELRDTADRAVRAARGCARSASAIRTADPDGRVTIGLHMEDLEDDRMLGPWEASEACDVLSMHGYPIYARWADGPTDEHLLPFLADVTRWLAGDATCFRGVRRSDLSPRATRSARRSSCEPLASDRRGGCRGVHRTRRLRRCAGPAVWARCSGATPTTSPAIWDVPPLDLAVHERSFGLWRADGSPKPSVAVVEAFAGAERVAGADDYTWIDLEPDEFFVDPGTHLRRLYRRYRHVSTKSD